MEYAREICDAKREMLELYMEGGLYPYSRFYLEGVKKATGEYFKNHFSTIGLNGMNEACRNLLGVDITTEEGNAFAVEIMDFMNRVIQLFQEETGSLWNLEASPAEGTSYRFARLDKKLYPNILTAGTDEPYYTNSTQLPVGATDDIFEAIELQEKLQTAYTGGTVLHGFIGEQIEDTETCKLFIRKIMENTAIPYITVTPTFSICEDHGYIEGEHFTCPHCGAKAEVYSRITGYYRPVQNWNEGKSQEYKNRKLYDIKHSVLKKPTKRLVTITEDDVKIEPATSVKYLFTTKTCPNCAMAKEMLADEEYVLIDAEENVELTQKYGVMQAPTLVVVDGDQAKKYVNASNIRKFVDMQ